MTNPIGAVMGALKFMPASLARQALEKVNPGFKNYFSKAISYGVDANRALDFLSERFESDAQREHKAQLDQGAANNTLRPDEMVSRSQMANQAIPGKIAKAGLSIATGGLLGSGGEEAPQQAANIIQEHSPELHDFLMEQIQSGISPLQAATVAYKNPNFTKIIADMERNLRQKFPSIVDAVFGKQQAPKAPSSAPAQQQQSPMQAAPQQQGFDKNAFNQALQQVAQGMNKLKQ